VNGCTPHRPSPPMQDNLEECPILVKTPLLRANTIRVGKPKKRGACMVRAIFRYAVLLAIFLVVGLVVFVAVTYPRFRADAQLNRERLLSASDIVTTEEFGDIEYAVQGRGLPVLLAHGAGGGYDQGLFIGENYVGDGHRFIAPSRFGYLRSSIPQNGSPAAQADAYAALLDTLGVERVAVVAFSDGGPSALQFALRHPERCAALVMISAKSQTPPPDTPLQELVFESVFRSDYVFWLITEYARPSLLTVFGVSGDVQEQMPARARQLVSDFVDSLNPISLREDGIYHDRDTLAVLPEDVFRLEQITVPTLVVHALDDGLQPYSHAENTATKVPDAKFLSYERGGHLLLLQLDDVREKVAAFHERHIRGA
jgi:pimeloyl-ACP methyl ester carboxylesterase